MLFVITNNNIEDALHDSQRIKDAKKLYNYSKINIIEEIPFNTNIKELTNELAIYILLKINYLDIEYIINFIFYYFEIYTKYDWKIQTALQYQCNNINAVCFGFDKSKKIANITDSIKTKVFYNYFEETISDKLLFLKKLKEEIYLEFIKNDILIKSATKI